MIMIVMMYTGLLALFYGRKVGSLCGYVNRAKVMSQ